MAEWFPTELAAVVPRLIFLGVVLMGFGYAAGNSRQLNGWKVGLILIVVLIFLEHFNHGKAALFVMLGAFLVGYLLPHANALEGFGTSVSNAINHLRYRNAYADIQRELKKAEELRREYEKMQKDQLREQAEAERARRRQRTRGGQPRGTQANDDGRRSSQNNGSHRKSNDGRSKPGDGQGSRRSSGTSGKNTSSSRSNDGRAKQSQGNQRASSSGQAPPHSPPALNALRDKYLDEIGLTPGRTYSKAEIKKAYRRTAIKCHPDKHLGKPQTIIDQMGAQFGRATTAYDWLYIRAAD